jgi:hypothetical protein
MMLVLQVLNILWRDGGEDSQSSEELSSTREVFEARHLISINEELGVKFLNDANE